LLPRDAFAALDTPCTRDRVLMLSDTPKTTVADDLWPLPTYREMLFMK
jgi:glutamine synthetase type III